MTRTVHNAVIGTISGSAGQGYMGSVYHQPSQFNFTPVGSATLTPPSASLPQPNGATLPPQTDTVFTSSPPITTTVPGGSASGFPLGWDPVTGFGMPPEAFVPSSSGQNNTVTSQQMDQQQSVSSSQPMTQNTSASQQTGQNMITPTPMGQVNASAPLPISQQQYSTSLQPISPTEFLISMVPHRGGVNWVFHDSVTGGIRHVNVPYVYPWLQQPTHQAMSQPAATNEMVLYQPASAQVAQHTPQMTSANQSVSPVSPQPASATQPIASMLPQCHRTVQIIPIKCTNLPFKLNPQLLHSISTPRLPAVTRIDYTGTLAKRRAHVITSNKSVQTYITTRVKHKSPN